MKSLNVINKIVDKLEQFLEKYVYKVAGVSIASIYDVDKLAQCLGVNDKDTFKELAEKHQLTS